MLRAPASSHFTTLALLVLSALTLVRAAVSAAEAQQHDQLSPHRFLAYQAGSMQTITWNDTIAAWADGCYFGHNGARWCCGENIWAGAPNNTGEDYAANPTWSWAGEAKNYNYNKDSCKSGATCGHYTQIVSANVTQIGCGIAYCPTLAPMGWSDGVYVVCDYWTPSNLHGGPKPYVACTTGVNCPTGPPGTSPASTTGTSHKSSGLSKGAIAGIVIGAIFGVIILAAIIGFIVYRKKKQHSSLF